MQPTIHVCFKVCFYLIRDSLIVVFSLCGSLIECCCCNIEMLFSRWIPFLGMKAFILYIIFLPSIHGTRVNFEPKNVTVHMFDTAIINYQMEQDLNKPCDLYIENNHIAEIIPNSSGHTFKITGLFLGRTRIKCRGAEGQLDVTVTRRKRTIDTIFTSSVAVLVSIIYINFGCALNWPKVWQSLKRPIGPTIGFLGQFLIMPLLSFGLGQILFPNNPEMQLGMFFTGVSPAGGASNIWTVVLEGNMDLSITMTTISTLAAFAMMPLWLFTLGKLIFDQGNITVPYFHISTYAIALVIPLAIGFLISRRLKNVANFFVRILKTFSALLLLFIIIFAIVTNLYLFELFSWEIVIAGMGLPYLGYVLGYLAAFILRQPPPDCLAIAIETGIQNTGIAIFLLRFTLPQPQADLTTVVPVSVAMMTPFPLLLMYIYKKVRDRVFPGAKLVATNKE